MQRDALIRAAEVIASRGDDDNVAEALRASGFSPREARILVDVLPEAFAVPILEELGALGLVSHASAKNAAGDWVEIHLEQNLIYAAALDLARAHRGRGILDHEAYRAIATRSSLINAPSKALDAGADLKGGQFALAFIGARAEDFDVRPWHERLWGRWLGNLSLKRNASSSR
jgi:hypothetical protein